MGAAEKAPCPEIASERNFHSLETGMPGLRKKVKKKETAFRSSKDVDNSESEKWLDA